MTHSAISKHVAALASIPAQPTAPALKPRTWTFTDRRTGRLVEFVCMEGCTINHAKDVETPTFPEDIWCWTQPSPLLLPVNNCGHPEQFRVLDTVIKVEPYSEKIAERLPYATIELVDDHFIDGLDPDGLETVINTLAARVEEMRETHRRLVEVREEYRKQLQARTVHASRNVRSQADEALRRVRGGQA